MNLKKYVSMFLLFAFITFQIPAFAVDLIIEPSTGEKSYTATSSVEAENQEALEEAKKAYASKESERDIDIVPMFQNWTKREAQRKVNNIGNKILISNNLDNFVRFEVSRKQSINAYADFHGTVTVLQGLLEYVENDDELAYVLGHELGHIVKDDSKTHLIRAGAMAAVVIAGAAIAASQNERPAARRQAAGTTAAGGAIAAGVSDDFITRKVEARADRIGIDLMVKAGYNPLASISMMNKILNRRWDGFYDHPSGNKRMIMAYQHIAKNYPKYLVAGFDTVSYERAMVYINKELAKQGAKQSAQSKKNEFKVKSKKSGKKVKVEKQEKTDDENL